MWLLSGCSSGCDLAVTDPLLTCFSSDKPLPLMLMTNTFRGPASCPHCTMAHLMFKNPQILLSRSCHRNRHIPVISPPSLALASQQCRRSASRRSTVAGSVKATQAVTTTSTSIQQVSAEELLVAVAEHQAELAVGRARSHLVVMFTAAWCVLRGNAGAAAKGLDFA